MATTAYLWMGRSIIRPWWGLHIDYTRGTTIASNTVRPSKAAYKKSIGTAAVVALPLGAVAAARLADKPLPLISFVLLIFALAAVCLWLYFRNTQIKFGDGSLARTNLFGVTQRWSADQVGAVVVVEQLTSFMQPETHNTFILDTEGRCILRPTNQNWADEEIGRLVGSIERTPERIKNPISAEALRKRYPRAVPWWEAHIFATAMIAAVAIVVVLFVAYMM